ncbi:uncharacterized protein VP01_2134g2 [Puccinia sorghi]|uniref:Uncharacterized protein n=1 Tax=Puccinia sorghi TaxID=27349 RepID=A0A0L6VBN6_9BASI|nr:uncharacterized protein VP01_2134g2 [Puccinia sorghi]
MWPLNDEPSGPVGSKKQESLAKSARSRAKVTRNELYPSENVCTGMVKAAVAKQRPNSSSLASKPLSQRALRPISVNIPTPIRLSPAPARKTGPNRFRSGSESKIHSLQPIASPSDSSRQPPVDSFEPCDLNQVDLAQIPSEPAETCQLSSQNLKTLSNLLKSNQSPHGGLPVPTTDERNSLFKPNEEGISEKFFSLEPTLGSSQRSGGSSDKNNYSSSVDSLVIGPTTLRSAFFDSGIILPGPHCGVDSTGLDEHRTENLSCSSESTLARLALMRLETMILKQRRVDFEPVETKPKLNPSLNKDEPLVQNDLDPASGRNVHSKAPSITKPIAIGKVRCALLESERLLGIKWIHNVDTTLTTNPHITPEVRYHASMLFSLYWGSRSPKVPKQDATQSPEPNTTRDLSQDREAKKKLKLIAATAMACLTLTIKWHFDFCKPLFTLQLMSFCKTTDFRTFRVTPEDLIIAERAILFSYPVAGGLWLDSPHAFLEELIHIIPSLRLLSNVPSYLRLPQGKKYSKNSSESKSNQGTKNDVRWDWPKVVHQVEKTLAKATMWQEVLAFEPSVLCVVALYISLDGVEAGYHENKHDTSITPDTTDMSKLPGQTGKETGLSELKSIGKGEESVSTTPAVVNDTGGPWIWRWIDINDTMDQVCRVTQVSGDDVENCLDWFCQSELF